jgi:hypothetical protein
MLFVTARPDAASMTGGIMPKLFAVRWPLAIVAGVLLLAGTIGFATALSSRPANDAAGRDDYAGERRQLLFFKAAVGRIDDELRHGGTAATASLRSEREAVLRRMREVASRVPADRMPPDIAAMLPPAPAAAASDTSARPTPLPPAKAVVREFQTGLGMRPAETDFSSIALDRPPPLPVYVERPARRAEHARDGENGEKTAERPARERSAKEKEKPAAQKPAKEPQSADRVVKERAPADRPPAARPPVTVERTAIAVQSEGRQPAQ